MSSESVPFLLVTANVGSVFEDPSRLLRSWINEFLEKITEVKPQFVALHLQEVGGKTYEKSMEYVQEFIQILCESNELKDFNRIRVFLDEDYTSAEHFTALGNLYFVEKSVEIVSIWNFLTREWETVDGKSIHTGNIEAVATKEKAKFPQHFFPECKWSRKGFLRTRWNINETIVDMVNIHLFHDASNLAASEEYPSMYCKSRRRALVHTLERFHQDTKNGLAPYFVFGDFNFRCDTEGVVRKLTEDLSIHRILNLKNDNYKVQYRDGEGCNVLTVGKKEFYHTDHQRTFKDLWLQQFDCELDPLKEVLIEYPITFPPSYPYEEEPSLPKDYMLTRCPAWCDRILMSPSAKTLIVDPNNIISSTYNTVGGNICMGDHKPVYLSVKLKVQQGTIRCSCQHANTNANGHQSLFNQKTYALATSTPCLYSSKEFCDILLECRKLDSPICVYDKTLSAPLANRNQPSPNPIQFTTNNQLHGNENNMPKKRITPTVSINVTDAENLNICMCSLYASSDTMLIEEQEHMTGSICPRCQNIIKQQPMEHRRRLISKQLTLANDIIVNRVDTQFLNLKPYQLGKRYEPYTPESIESHSPAAEIDEEINGNSTNDDERNQYDGSANINDDDIEISDSNKKCSIPISPTNSGVSPRQLMARLEKLRQFNAPDISGDQQVEAKNRTKDSCCFTRICVIL